MRATNNLLGLYVNTTYGFGATCGEMLVVALPVAFALVAVGGLLINGRYREREPQGSDADAVEAPAASGEPVQAETRKARAKKRKSKGPVTENTEAESLPVLPVGTRCWHRELNEECIVLKVRMPNHKLLCDLSLHK